LSTRILERLKFEILLIVSEKGARKEIKSIDIDIINLFLKINFYSLLFNIKKMKFHLIDIKFNSEFSISRISKNCYNLEILPISTLSHLFNFISNVVRSPAEPEREIYIWRKYNEKNRKRYFKNIFRIGSIVFRVILRRFSRLKLTAVIIIRKVDRISIFVIIYKEIIAVKAIFLFVLIWLLILYLLNILILGNRRSIYQITRKIRILNFRPRILLYLTKLQNGDDLQIRLKK
jgi:hypothetical protein